MRNNTLITLLLSVFIAFFGIGIIVPIMPVFAKTLGAGGFALGMVIAARILVNALLGATVLVLAVIAGALIAVHDNRGLHA